MRFEILPAKLDAESRYNAYVLYTPNTALWGVLEVRGELQPDEKRWFVYQDGNTKYEADTLAELLEQIRETEELTCQHKTTGRNETTPLDKSPTGS